MNAFASTMASLERYLAAELSRHSQEALAGYVQRLNAAVQPPSDALLSCSLQTDPAEPPANALPTAQQLQMNPVKPVADKPPPCTTPSPRAQASEPHTAEAQQIQKRSAPPALDDMLPQSFQGPAQAAAGAFTAAQQPQLGFMQPVPAASPHCSWQDPLSSAQGSPTPQQPQTESMQLVSGPLHAGSICCPCLLSNASSAPSPAARQPATTDTISSPEDLAASCPWNRSDAVAVQAHLQEQAMKPSAIPCFLSTVQPPCQHNTIQHPCRPADVSSKPQSASDSTAVSHAGQEFVVASQDRLSSSGGAPEQTAAAPAVRSDDGRCCATSRTLAQPSPCATACLTRSCGAGSRQLSPSQVIQVELQILPDSAVSLVLTSLTARHVQQSSGNCQTAIDRLATERSCGISREWSCLKAIESCMAVPMPNFTEGRECATPKKQLPDVPEAGCITPAEAPSAITPTGQMKVPGLENAEGVQQTASADAAQQAMRGSPVTSATAGCDSWKAGLQGTREPARELAEAAGAAVAAEASERAWAGPFPWPLYLIGTRDCFTNHLVPVTEQASDF